MRRLATVCGSAAGMSVGAAAVGWPGIVLAVGTVACFVVGACWVLNDTGRSTRLARLIRELRQ